MRPVVSDGVVRDDWAVKRIVLAFLAGAGVVLGVLAYRVQIDNLPYPLTTQARAMATVVAAWSFLAAGLIAWLRRPGNRLGPLMVATCFALLARQFRFSLTRSHGIIVGPVPLVAASVQSFNPGDARTPRLQFRGRFRWSVGIDDIPFDYNHLSG